MSGTRAALQRIGGPYAITRPSIWVAMAVSILMQSAEAVDTFAPRQLPARVLVILVPFLVMVGVLLGLQRLLLRDVDRHPRPGRTIAVFVAAALARGVMIAVLFPPLLDLPGKLAFRIGGSLLVLVPTLVITALIVDRARTRAALLVELQQAARRLDAAGTMADDDIRAAHDEIIARVRQTLLAAVEDSAGATPADVVARLRTEVDEGIRPLSHRLAHAVPEWSPTLEVAASGRFAWRDLWRDVTRGEAIRPVLMGAPTAVMTMPMSFNRLGFPAGLVVPITAAVLVIGGFALGRALVGSWLRRTPSASARAVVFVATVLVVVWGTALAIRFAITPNGTIFVAIAVVGPVVVLLLALAQAVSSNLRQIEAELEATTIALDRAVTRVRQVAWQRQRVLALAIHGPLQAKVSAAALRLEQQIAAGTASADAVDTALDSVVEALDELEADTGQAGDLLADLADVAEAWDGVCAVGVDVDADLADRIDRDPVSARVIVDVFTEACSNAVRHAGAREIALRIDEDEERLLHVVVRDDGRAEETTGRGLGSQILDEVAVRWDRERTDAATRLEVVLPGLPA